MRTRVKAAILNAVFVERTRVDMTHENVPQALRLSVESIEPMIPKG